MNKKHNLRAAVIAALLPLLLALLFAACGGETAQQSAALPEYSDEITEEVSEIIYSEEIGTEDENLPEEDTLTATAAQTDSFTVNPDYTTTGKVTFPSEIITSSSKTTAKTTAKTSEKTTKKNADKTTGTTAAKTSEESAKNETQSGRPSRTTTTRAARTPTTTAAPKTDAPEAPADIPSSSTNSSTTKASSSTTAAPVTTKKSSQSSTTAPKTYQVKVTIDVKNALAYGKSGLPKNGILLETYVPWNEGMTARDALDIAAGNNIEVDGKRNYVKSIGGLAEFDCGANSGWLYSVNGEFPNKAASSYELKNGDEVVWIYSVKPGDTGYNG